jgi:NAD(P)-dependent dehydrogenase (short-subunit alcohol dehydrogenase family)
MMAEKRVALVTGANKGIGFETSRQLAARGIKVLMGARDEERGHTAVDGLKSAGLDVDLVLLDVTNPEQIEQGRETIEKEFGRLDILVNNAGIAHAEDTHSPNSAATVSMQALRETFNVNFFGLVELTRVLLPLIRKSGAGRIVNVSSMLGSLTLHSDPEGGIQDFKPLAYDASKAAVNMFTVHLAALLKDTAVKVNSAHPGWVRTDLGGPQAPMDVKEGAKTSVMLATLDREGPTGGFFHMGEIMPW